MDFKREKSKNYFLDDTPVPNIFIAEYLPDAPGNHVKVYLYAFMYSGINHILSNESIAKNLGLSVEDVSAAWTYFEKYRAIRKIYPDPDDKLRYNVIFIDLKSGVFSNAGDAAAEKQTGKAAYGAGLGHAALKELFREIERITGKPIPGGDYQKIGFMLEDYDVGPEIIACAYRYCVKKGKRFGASYVEGIVRDWDERNLRTEEAVTEYLERCDLRYGQYKQIMKALGLGSSSVTDAERSAFDLWLDDMGMSLESILDVCRKAAGKNNKFAYVKKIIESDFEKSGGNLPSAASGKTNRKRFYETRRLDSENSAKSRVAEVYARCPEIKILDKEISDLNMELVGVMISGADNRKDAATQIKSRAEKKAAERDALMEKSGFPINYTDILYHCPLCKDTGILDNGVSCSCFKISEKTM
ncbi:MAG: DnaD domain protein [Clostridiales Family XIII bacterium]|jgi:DnaD/phage-associated family protein|nr:DnaD domain protein [Clostridiales Family XIII bacterium]